MANIFTDAWYKITTGKTASQIEEETARANEINARRDADLIARGVWDQKAARDSAAQRGAEDYYAEIGRQTGGAAVEGATEGLATVQGGFRDVLTGATTFSLRAVFGFVPWWLWIAAAAYIAFRLDLLGPAIKSLIPARR